MDTEALRNFSNVLLILGLIAAACGTFGVNHFRGRLEKEREVAAKRKEQEAETRAAALQTKIDELIAGKNALVGQNEKLLGDIQVYKKDLHARDERIQELEVAAQAAKRGVMNLYDFNGARRVQSAGRVSVTVGEESEVFQRMLALGRSADFAALIPLCEKQIQATPDWLTPYFFLGAAYAETGHREKAIKNLRHVVARAGGDPAYKDAEELLQRLLKNP